MIIAIDTETYEYDKAEGVYKPVLNAKKFVLGCAKTDKGKTEFFYNPDEMWNWLIETIEYNKSRGERTFIYAHHHEFDWYSYAQNNLLNKDIKYICYQPFIAIYKEKGYFLDSMAFYRMSLDLMGEILKFPKLEMPKTIKHIDDLKEYIERDTDIVLKGIIDIREKISELGFKPRKLLTAGQLAITSFMTYCRREGIDRTFTEYNPDKKIRQIVKSKHSNKIREAFRGGMNQCFKIGKFKNVTLVDANALYAYCMTKIDFPDLRTETFNKNVPVGMLKKYFNDFIGVARVKLYSPAQSLPFLPVRFTKYTVYPSNKHLRGTWTFAELKKAIELGYEIQECEWCIRWTKSEINPLKGFVEYLYNIEKDLETKEQKLPLKLIRNNLYGKFAQNKANKDYKLVDRYKIHEYTKEGYKPVSSVDNKYICVKEVSDYVPSYNNPIISALITAYGRMYLWEFLKRVPYDDRLYCDTDSIAFKGDYLDLFNISNKMGDWKIEVQGNAKFLGEKRYYIDDKAKISGLMKKEISIDVIDKEGVVKTVRMIGLKTGILTGNLDNVGTFVPHLQDMTPHNKDMLFLPDIIDEVKEYGLE